MTSDPGYTPEEIERGDDRAWHIPVWGCLAVIAVAVIVAVIVWHAIATSTDL